MNPAIVIALIFAGVVVFGLIVWGVVALLMLRRFGKVQDDIMSDFPSRNPARINRNR